VLTELYSCWTALAYVASGLYQLMPADDVISGH